MSEQTPAACGPRPPRESMRRHESPQPLEVRMPRRDVRPLRRDAQVAQHLERTHEHRQRRTAGGEAFEVRGPKARRRILDETLHELIVMLRGDAPVQIAELEI